MQHDFDDFDLMEIEFTKTKEPFNRIVVDYFSFGDITDFTMERQDMISSPKSIKQELVKAVRVPCYSYQKGTAEETLISEETEAVKEIFRRIISEIRLMDAELRSIPQHQTSAL